MRIIGNIDHPELKISVFKMDDRITVKFENRSYELGIKIGSDERLSNLEAVREWVDSSLTESVQALLLQLHQSRLAADTRSFPAQSVSEFEEII
jgi:hypothetical protein